MSFDASQLLKQMNIFRYLIRSVRPTCIVYIARAYGNVVVSHKEVLAMGLDRTLGIR